MEDNKRQDLSNKKSKEINIREICPLPVGYKDEKCPNILCLNCGYWRD